MKLAYPKFWWKSNNQHGIHSPFVYRLVTQCFYDKKPVEKKTEIDAFYQKIATSKHFDKATKKSLISLQQAYFLNRIGTYFSVKNAIEIGSSLGLESKSFALSGIEQLHVFTEVNREIKYTQEKLASQKNIRFHQIEELQNHLEKKQEKIDLAFIHTQNQLEKSKAYFEQVLPYLHNDSLVIFDNLYLSKEMQDLWTYVKNHSKVKVTIDGFYFGFVFFRAEQVKENFMIRLNL